MKRREIQSEPDRRVAIKAMVAFSGLVHAWKVGEAAKMERRKRELAHLGVKVAIEAPTKRWGRRECSIRSEVARDVRR